MKITFLGAGSTVFAKNVLGDCIINPRLGAFDIALFDIDEERLDDSYQMLNNINHTMHGRATIKKYTNRLEALRGAKYVINAVQIGGYEPSTVIDFEIPRKYGLKQTIGDTLGIGGIFRALRTIPVMEDFARDMEQVCPDALFLNYVNPMAILTGYMLRYTKIKTVGLCHSVQLCVPKLLKAYKMEEYLGKTKWEIAGINHMAWLLKIEDLNGNDLYPEIKRRNLVNKGEYPDSHDLVRMEIMRRFNYYVTESSEHNAEYLPYFIKKNYPELITKFNIPLDEYPRRCVKQINDWKEMRDSFVNIKELTHERSHEYASSIIEACETDVPFRIHGNVLNHHLITNLPLNACVEVPIMIDRNGLNPCIVGDLPEQLAALNRTNINVQLLTMEAAHTLSKDKIYQAAYLDPHTSSELSLDEIKALCDDLIEAHGNWLPKYH
ncbi:MAG: alpha-glucosidase/alpha-galactosidase [Tenericutes bacterium GWC2_34_14]|nr:MAG: alpha-glucosidase/alpha-galactosidase [Tenericutes bacterium GWA2_35_7]OHE29404.1 MAG: alpha-glucosidase/alpha-galactosidase [Tenericutes bacterium GWC2_34_14]OHE34500.1 MAG: alpha-glucosidase/alpha-galactosidase [Tenericutes bacterium GWE2_34_108]OHE35857.1 MAG: alpha-glucosidase/alpha-galactosidase [Tenericutes bacterium GWF1_35_14]OHE39057.1 MAG: alpha-glucosidase/alpha-galactosidase [Tenericutes bacterium GWF2_35_184]OHE42876.1 MAG: alpha-glucosidase/alpha-galactosidase [Tenericute